MRAYSRSAAAGQATRRNVHGLDKHILAQSADKWLGLGAIALGWVLAFAAIVTLHAVSTTATFELAAFASLLFGFGAGWCARGGRR